MGPDTDLWKATQIMPETKVSAQKCHKPSGSCVNQWLHCCLENKLHESVWQCRCLTAILYHNIMVAVTVGKTILFLIFLHSSFNVIDANCEWEIWWWRLSSFFFSGRNEENGSKCVLCVAPSSPSFSWWTKLGVGWHLVLIGIADKL